MKKYASEYWWVVLKEHEKIKGEYKLVKFLCTIPRKIEGYKIAKSMCNPDEIVRFYKKQAK